VVIDGRAQAILWAQWRTLLAFYRKPQMGGHWVGTIVMGFWYLMVAGGAVGLGFAMSTERLARAPQFETVCSFGLLVAFLYWQFVPVFLASTGMSIDMKRLTVYPIRPNQLFQIEVLLRLTTGVEVVLLLLGVGVGALLNPALPKWGPLGLLVFLVMNLYLSAGVRDLMARVLERKGMREAFVLVLVMLMVAPQMLSLVGVPDWLKEAALEANQGWLPWGAAAGLLAGKRVGLDAVALLGWTVAAVLFGRWQFERSLRFDGEALRAKESEANQQSAWLDGIFRLPAMFFRDPLAALLEKDLKQLARSPRFRLVFFMGFTFGLIIWLPLVFRQGLFSGKAQVTGVFSANYLTWLSIYALMMLGEVAIFNSMGFDRAAAQFYWATPASMRMVLQSKNLAATFYIFLELAIISLVCLVLRLPVTPLKIAEAFAVTLVLAIFFTGIGNIGSTFSPRAANPQQSWRNSSGSKFQLWMLVFYPILSVPITLAYLARYGFESDAAFFVVLLVTGLIGVVFYRVATDSALERAAERKEAILAALSQGDGPIR
jgi:ABC-2 type transport system permease protein